MYYYDSQFDMKCKIVFNEYIGCYFIHFGVSGIAFDIITEDSFLKSKERFKELTKEEYKNLECKGKFAN